MEKFSITDERMFYLMNYAIKEGVFKNESDCFKQINCHRTNISNIKSGKQSFTRQQIYKMCELTGASADYIFGFTENIMRKEGKTPIEMIKLAVSALESNGTAKKAVPRTLPRKK